MEICLAFPPGWDTTQPYLSTPFLKAYLEKKGNNNIRTFDLNIEFYDYFLSANALRKSYAFISNTVFQTEEGRIYQCIKNELIDHIDSAKNIFRSELFYSKKERVKAQRIIELAFLIHNLAYEKLNISFDRILVNDLNFNDIIITSFIENTKLLPFSSWYNNFFAKKLNKNNELLFGISLVSYDQLIPTFLLAKFIKENHPKSHIVLGGEIATRLGEVILKHEILSKYIDSIILYEGEETLHILIEKLKNDFYNPDLNKLPNYISSKYGIVKCSSQKVVTNLAKQPVPDFSGMPLDKYLSPQLILPIISSKGCYWGKCTFCEESGKQFYEKTDVQLFEEITLLSEKYNTKYFGFAEDSSSPRILNNISKRLKDNKIDIRWRTIIRAEKVFKDPKLANRLYNSGCRLVLIGIESGSKKISSEIIKKGIDISNIPTILNNCFSNNIWTHCYFMFGLPEETYADTLETFKLIKESKQNIGSFSFNKFMACKGTPIMKKKNDLNFKILDDLNNPWIINYKKIETGFINNMDLKRINNRISESLDLLSTDYNEWLSLHLNHLFLLIEREGIQAFKRN